MPAVEFDRDALAAAPRADRQRIAEHLEFPRFEDFGNWARTAWCAEKQPPQVE